jgi:hypothetical protein
MSHFWIDAEVRLRPRLCENSAGEILGATICPISRRKEPALQSFTGDWRLRGGILREILVEASFYTASTLLRRSERPKPRRLRACANYRNPPT